MEMNEVNVDDALFEVLETFSNAADKINAPWLMIGATARIILLEKIYGWPTGVATQDVDFAVQVGDWEHYSQLCELIIENEIFETGRKPTKRFRTKRNRVFDLVPYDGVENENKQVFWPPDNDDVMTVRGFESAAKDALNIIVNKTLTVPVVSPRGLCALKLFAWYERHAQHPGRDASDIAYLLRNIEHLYSVEKLHNEYPDAVRAADYEINNAGHYQLGSDVKYLLPNEELLFLSNIISGELKRNEDSILCRELHKYTKMQSIEDTLTALKYFYLGLKI